jgi:pimeloyl-ACP methyl ester carboxylesterase
MTAANVNGIDLYFDTVGAGETLVLTHGSWTDGSGWAPAVPSLAERYHVVTWDRRGHSRSQDGNTPGSRVEDAADLAGLIEYLDCGQVHLAGNSYGAIVALAAVTDRPDLVASAAVHEPPLFGLLEGTADPRVAEALIAVQQPLQSVAALIEAGDHRAAAELFIDGVALGPGSWAQMPEPVRALIASNACTYLDELHDPTALTIDTSALTATTVPLQLTYGTASPMLFPKVIDQLASLVPTARVAILHDVGHIPHASHPERWTATLLEFLDQLDRGGREAAVIGGGTDSDVASLRPHLALTLSHNQR